MKASIPAPMTLEETRGTACNRLGPVLEEFKQYPVIPNLLIGFLVSLGSLPILGYCVASSHPNPATTADGWVLIHSLSGLSLLAAVLLWILRYIQRNDRYVVFKHGIGKVSMGQMTSLRWDEIASLSRGEIMVGNKATHEILPFLTIQNATGTELRIGDRSVFILRKPVDRLADLVEAIESHAQHYLYPDLLARFNRGETLDFGPFTANRAGISFKGRTIP